MAKAPKAAPEMVKATVTNNNGSGPVTMNINGAKTVIPVGAETEITSTVHEALCLVTGVDVAVTPSKKADKKNG